jgi:two-component system response regulator
MDYKASILIVDDDPVVSKILSRMLERKNYNICNTAATGKEAIESAKIHQPDLVLLDVNLRGELNGIETARHIAEAQKTCFIFLTGYTIDDVRDQTDFLDQATCLMKPVRNDDLIATIEKTLAYQAPGDDNAA